MSGSSALDEMIETFRRLEDAPAEVAKLAAPLVEAAAKATASAGTTPDGAPWAPTKAGGKALVHAADALSTKANGPTIITTLEGVEVIHNYGSKKVPERRILPDGGAGVPPVMAAAVEKAAGVFFDRATRGV